MLRLSPERRPSFHHLECVRLSLQYHGHLLLVSLYDSDNVLVLQNFERFQIPDLVSLASYSHHYFSLWPERNCEPLCFLIDLIAEKDCLILERVQIEQLVSQL